MINHLFQWEWLSWWQNVPAYARNSKGPQWFACICALTIYGFAGLAVVHLSNPAVRICRQVISTLRLEHRWISPKTICLFSNSNHQILLADFNPQNCNSFFLSVKGGTPQSVTFLTKKQVSSLNWFILRISPPLDLIFYFKNWLKVLSMPRKSPKNILLL